MYIYSFPVSIPFFLEHSLIALKGAITDAGVKVLLLKYKWDDTVLATGITLQESANNLEMLQKRLHLEQYQAYADFMIVFTQAKETFTEIAKLFEMAFDEENHKVLELIKETRKQKLHLKWLQKCKEFYAAAIEDDYPVQKVSIFGLTKENLEAARKLVTDSEDAKVNHNRLKGEAEQATKDRDDALKELYKYMKRFITICEMAFKDKPQYMEKLGINKLSEGYKRKNKKDDDETETETQAEEPQTEEPQQAEGQTQ
jgi:hypothetical protein